jgi:hypothetical protein
VLGDGGEAHPEGAGQLGDRRFTRGEARKNRAPGRVGERGEGGVEAVMGSDDLTLRLINYWVKYNGADGLSRSAPPRAGTAVAQGTYP